MDKVNKLIFNENELTAYVGLFERRYIYGAGYVGNLLKKRMKKRGIDFDAFITTVIDRNVDGQLGLKDIIIDDNTIVVVAVTEKYREKIINILKENYITQYVIISDKLIRTMERIEYRKLRFQTHIVEHCNLNCRGCYHFSSLANEEFLDIEEFSRDLKRLSTIFEGCADEILLLGGEPLLHPQISEFVRLSRKFFPVGNIKILTNGTKLLSIEDEFFSTLEKNKVELWVTRYPIKFDYDLAEERARKMGVKINYFTDEDGGRTLGHEPLDISGKRNYLDNFYNCYRAHECVDLKHGRLYSCIVPAEVKAFSNYFGVEMPISPDDYIDIYKIKSPEELLEQLERPIPFCRFCNRDDIQVVGRIPWSTTKYDIKEWTE